MSGVKGMKWDEDKKSDNKNVWCRLSADRLSAIEKIKTKFKFKKRSHVITLLVEFALDKIAGGEKLNIKMKGEDENK
jgi:hypothetical protein